MRVRSISARAEVTNNRTSPRIVRSSVSTRSPANSKSGSASPNPSRGGLEFEFRLPRKQAVRLTVLDVTGRNVATLLSTTLGPGPQRAAWTGRTSSGDTAPAGVYLCELHTEAGRVARRFVVLP